MEKVLSGPNAQDEQLSTRLAGKWREYKAAQAERFRRESEPDVKSIVNNVGELFGLSAEERKRVVVTADSETGVVNAKFADVTLMPASKGFYVVSTCPYCGEVTHSESLCVTLIDLCRELACIEDGTFEATSKHLSVCDKAPEGILGDPPPQGIPDGMIFDVDPMDILAQHIAPYIVKYIDFE